jgi:O-antigen ligase
LKRLLLIIDQLHLKYRKIPIYFIGFLVFLMAFQQLPVIRDSYYDGLRFGLYSLFGASILYSLQNLKVLFHFKFYNIFIVIITYALILSIIMVIVGGDLLPVALLIVPFGILTLALTNQYSQKDLLILLWVFSISNVLMGLINIFYYGEGFNITGSHLVPEKNQIGPMIGYSILIFLYFINSYKKIWLKMIASGLVVFSLLILLAVRNRSAIVGISLMIVFILGYSIYIGIKKLLQNNKREVLITFGVITIVTFIGLQLEVIQALLERIWLSITYNRVITDLNSLSSGRYQLILDSFMWIETYPLFGFIGIETIPISEYTHVYVLHTLMQYGILGSIPFLIFYVVLILLTLRILIRIDRDPINLLIFMIFSVSLIISVLEYSYPYGPGVSQFILWFVLGQYTFRNQDHAT